jgi:hypothetical protein
VYEIRTPSKNLIRFFTTGQLEVDWRGGAGRTIVLPTGVRFEVFQNGGPETFYVEMFVREKLKNIQNISKLQSKIQKNLRNN